MVGSDVGAESDGAADQIGGGLMLPDHVGDQPQKVQRVRLVRPGGQDLPIQRLGFGQPPCLMVGDGLLEQLLGGGGVHGLGVTAGARLCGEG